ncbi:RING finger protein 37 isoform X2 [Neoarius graeffei]|uniref:RING finger protein 37 isoform X2 n=1 Tax=Neoarius graeffei TaxID=443677 RepID=UPI00298D1B90|nr:RING finger protein 37 isoform X2 [Neoarius graeffei]
MAVNLCLPHFKTTAYCNKLCADGCDVSNLLSGDPAALRRGCRLEYFLRPPLHVTLRFQVKVELYRVDVQLLPCGNASRRLEILTCSEVKPAKTSENDQEREQFKLVGRCELSEEVLICFKHPNFKLRAPFSERPPDPPAHAKQQKLWSQGFQALNSVAQLRITVPYGGASSALGIKSLVVWGVPAHCCSLSELEQFQKAHFDSLQPKLSSLSILSPVSTSVRSPRPDNAFSETTIPEEFLDPLTQELMVLPMILPSGMVVDNSTLEEYQKQEAAWGRMPNDPFTGVPFTKDSKPLPNPLLKSRIDTLLLQTGHKGIRSKNGLLNKPRPSRLVCASVSPTDLLGVQRSQAETQTQKVHSVSTECTKMLQKHTVSEEKNHSRLINSQSRCFEDRQGIILGSSSGTCRRENLGQSNKRKYQSSFSTNREHLFHTFLSPLIKMPRTDAGITLPTETNSHEERLSQSLDQALSSALHGLPTYTSQNSLQPDTTGGRNQKQRYMKKKEETFVTCTLQAQSGQMCVMLLFLDFLLFKPRGLLSSLWAPAVPPMSAA